MLHSGCFEPVGVVRRSSFGVARSWHRPRPSTSATGSATSPISPSPGVLFKDITPLLSNPDAFQTAIDQLEEQFRDRGIDVIAAAEARGFIFGAPLAVRMNAGFVPIRKPGKLPYATIAQEYQLEYGSRPPGDPHRRPRRPAAASS